MMEKNRNMNAQKDFWGKVSEITTRHKEHILSDEQRKLIAVEEQKAYEGNMQTINDVIEEFAKELKALSFWTEIHIEKDRASFRFNTNGYYGPGGFSSQYHMAGPLVLGVINPKGSATASFYDNDLDANVQIGCNFDKTKFIEFVQKIIMEFISPNNLIVSKEQYEYLRNFNNSN